MKIIRTKLLRIIGKKLITLPWGIYAAPMALVSEEDLAHELTHVAQYREITFTCLILTLPVAFIALWVLLIPFVVFYLWFGIEWLVHFIRLKDPHLAYRRISFEREAYDNEDDPEYLMRRAVFAFLKYLR